MSGRPGEGGVLGGAVGRDELGRLADARGLAGRDVLRLGSLLTAVACERAEFRDAILALFRTDPGRHQYVEGAEADAALVVFEAEDADGVLCAAPPDGLAVTTHAPGRRWTIATDALTCHVFSGPRIAIHLAIRGRPADDLAFRVHLSVALHRALFLLDRLYLHAAGVRFGDVCALFVGDKGAGKSTLSLALGAAGATVLADDHMVLRRVGDGFVASGCDGEARLLPDAEHHLFGGPVDAPVVELGGVRKKEIAVGRYFASDPFREHAVGRLVFPRVGRAFRIAPLAKGAALVALMDATRSSHRFAGPDDYGAYLDYLSALVDATDAFTLELSPDLSQLRRLAEWMRDGAS